MLTGRLTLASRCRLLGLSEDSRITVKILNDLRAQLREHGDSLGSALRTAPASSAAGEGGDAPSAALQALHCVATGGVVPCRAVQSAMLRSAALQALRDDQALLHAKLDKEAQALPRKVRGIIGCGVLVSTFPIGRRSPTCSRPPRARETARAPSWLGSCRRPPLLLSSRPVPSFAPSLVAAASPSHHQHHPPLPLRSDSTTRRVGSARSSSRPPARPPRTTGTGSGCPRCRGRWGRWQRP